MQPRITSMLTYVYIEKYILQATMVILLQYSTKSPKNAAWNIIVFICGNQQHRI